MAKKLIGKLLGSDKVIDAVKDTTDKLLDQRYTKQERAQDEIRVLEMHEKSRNLLEEIDNDQFHELLSFMEQERKDAEQYRQSARDFDVKRQSSSDFLQRNASILVGLTLIAFCFSLILILVLADPPIEARLSDKVLDMSSWIILAVTGYFLGSSQGSAVKNRLLENGKSRD